MVRGSGGSELQTHGTGAPGAPGAEAAGAAGAAGAAEPRLALVMLAGVSVFADSVAELASKVRTAGAGELADRLERALRDEVKLLALTIDERRSSWPRSSGQAACPRRRWPIEG